MNLIKRSILMTTLGTLASFSIATYASTLTDLQNTLNRLQGTTYLSAEFEAITQRNKGEGKDKTTKNGQVNISLEADEDGLLVRYSNELLTKIEDEAQQKVEDEEAETEALNAINSIGSTELNTMVSASSSLLRLIKQATFISEEEDTLQGKKTRLLRFTLPMKYFLTDKKTRSYVKKFKAEYLIWLDETGIPLQSKTAFTGKGRAYIFFSISASGSTLNEYQIMNDRLVVVRKESKNQNDNTFGYFERSAVKTLKVAPL